ncbi:hypothetical protein Tco_0814058 [Tanacetum coccineum]
MHDYYLMFTQLINDMHSIAMTMMPIQINTKFINHLQPEWSKFVTDVKLVKDLHNTNFDHLYGYLRQHESHANELSLFAQQYYSPLVTVSPMIHHQSTLAPKVNHSSAVQQQAYQPQDVYHSLIVHHQSYQAPPHQQPQASFPQLDSGLVVPLFLPTDDPIASLNKAMAFISITFTS